MPCGLPEVRFAAGQGDLDPVARCQLIAVAPCIVSHRFYVQLKAHASADEVASEEAAILLSDQRSSAVRTILMNHGVRCESVTSLAVGDLQPTGREADEDRRVEIRLIPASGTDGLVPLAATGCPPE